SAGGTIDVSIGSGAPTFTATTSKGNTNSLLGTGPAFATFNNGATWATASGGNVVGLASYGTTFTTNTNVDVTTSSNLSTLTVHSLRSNSGSPALPIQGPLTLQSGGILVTANHPGGSIAGPGTLTASSSGELIVHQYSSATFAIDAPIVSTVGLTKAG